MDHDTTRRGCALEVPWAWGPASLFALSSGVLSGFDLAAAAEPGAAGMVGTPLFVQLSDSHIGFNKAANPDVAGTFERAIGLVNALLQGAGLRAPHRGHHPSLPGH